MRVDRIPAGTAADRLRPAPWWGRAVAAVAVGGATAVLAAWAVTIGHLAASGFTFDGYGPAAEDLRAFVLAAESIVDGMAVSMYDVERFAAAGATAFLNPPFFAVVFVPLVPLTPPVAWGVWTAVSVAALVAAAALVGGRRSALVAPAVVLLTFPGFTAVRLGQTSLLSALLLAAAYRLLVRRRMVASGAVAGGLVYKPWLASGLLLWWLVSARRFRSTLIAALAVGAVPVAWSALVLPGAWTRYLDTLGSAWSSFAEGSYAELTLWHSFHQMLPWLPGAAVTALTAIGSLGIVIAFARHTVAVRSHLGAAFAGSVSVALLLAPHVYVYDWVVLVVPFLALWGSFPRMRRALLMAGTALSVAAIATWPLGALGWRTLGVSLPVGYVALLAATAVIGRRLRIEVATASVVPAASP